MTAVSVLVFIVLTVLLWDIFKTISTEEGRLQFRNMITALGARGCLMLIGLNISQIFLFFIPGEMVELLAGMCYGAAGGLIVTYIGALLPSVRAARFILLSTLFRFPAIFTSTVAGNSFAGGDYRTAGIVYVATFVISLIILRYCARKDAVREIMEINKG